MSKCQNCEFGGMILGFHNSIYIFKEAIKIVDSKIISINYNKNECGCRLSQWLEKENRCLQNNFSEYIEFTLEK